MRVVALLLGVASLLALAGCGSVQPWVKPYEREHLADPIMAWDSNALVTGYITHVHENREAAKGGTGTTGGGCGCN